MLKPRLEVVSEWRMIEGLCMRWQDNGGEKSRMEEKWTEGSLQQACSSAVRAEPGF